MSSSQKQMSSEDEQQEAWQPSQPTCTWELLMSKGLDILYGCDAATGSMATRRLDGLCVWLTGARGCTDTSMALQICAFAQLVSQLQRLGRATASCICSLSDTAERLRGG